MALERIGIRPDIAVGEKEKSSVLWREYVVNDRMSIKISSHLKEILLSKNVRFSELGRQVLSRLDEISLDPGGASCVDPYASTNRRWVNVVGGLELVVGKPVVAKRYQGECKSRSLDQQFQKMLTLKNASGMNEEQTEILRINQVFMLVQSWNEWGKLSDEVLFMERALGECLDPWADVPTDLAKVFSRNQSEYEAMTGGNSWIFLSTRLKSLGMNVDDLLPCNLIKVLHGHGKHYYEMIDQGIGR